MIFIFNLLDIYFSKINCLKDMNERIKGVKKVMTYLKWYQSLILCLYNIYFLLVFSYYIQFVDVDRLLVILFIMYIL